MNQWSVEVDDGMGTIRVLRVSGEATAEGAREAVQRNLNEGCSIVSVQPYDPNLKRRSYELKLEPNES